MVPISTAAGAVESSTTRSFASLSTWAAPALILPPDYKGDLNPPVGGAEAEVNGQKYFVARSGGYVNWLILRGFLVDGKPDDATAMFKNGLKVYPLALAGKAPDMKFINASSIQEGLQHDPREQLLVLLE